MRGHLLFCRLGTLDRRAATATTPRDPHVEKQPQAHQASAHDPCPRGGARLCGQETKSDEEPGTSWTEAPIWNPGSTRAVQAGQGSASTPAPPLTLTLSTLQRKRCRDPRCSPRGNPACRVTCESWGCWRRLGGGSYDPRLLWGVLVLTASRPTSPRAHQQGPGVRTPHMSYWPLRGLACGLRGVPALPGSKSSIRKAGRLVSSVPDFCLVRAASRLRFDFPNRKRSTSRPYIVTLLI